MTELPGARDRTRRMSVNPRTRSDLVGSKEQKRRHDDDKRSACSDKNSNPLASSGSDQSFSVCLSEGDPDRQMSVAAHNNKTRSEVGNPVGEVRSMRGALSESNFGGTIYRDSSQLDSDSE